MPWLMVNQTRLASDSAVPTPLFALDVQRAGIPGRPGASNMVPRSVWRRRRRGRRVRRRAITPVASASPPRRRRSATSAGRSVGRMAWAGSTTGCRGPCNTRCRISALSVAPDEKRHPARGVDRRRGQRQAPHADELDIGRPSPRAAFPSPPQGREKATRCGRFGRGRGGRDRAVRPSPRALRSSAA